MKKTTTILTFLLGCALAIPAAARNTLHKFPIAEAVAAAAMAADESKLDPEVQMFWGNQSFPTPVQTMGTYTSNKKTNFFNKSDKEGCEWVWLSAAKALQERAKREGGNAVVNIKSYYKSNEFVSETEYECGAGAILGGVALRGTVVKLP